MMDPLAVLGLFLIFGFVPLVYVIYEGISNFINSQYSKNYSKDLNIRKDILLKIQRYNESIPWSEKFTTSKVFNDYKQIVCEHDYYDPKRMKFYNNKLYDLYKEFIPEWKQQSRKEKLSNILD